MRSETKIAGIVAWFVLFAPPVLLLWPEVLRAVAPDISRQQVFQWLPVYQILVGVVFAEILAVSLGYRSVERYASPVRLRAGAAAFWMSEGPLRGWLAALALLCGAQAVQWTIMRSAPVAWPLPPEVAWALAAQLGFYLFFIALPEELWFRGLWFELVGRRFVPGVVGGAALFALLHAHQGPAKVLMTFGIGLAFGAARWAGAPLVALILAHGIMNWLNSAVAPGFAAVINDSILPFAVLAGFVLLAALIAALGKFERKAP